MDIVNRKDCHNENCKDRGANLRTTCWAYKKRQKPVTNADRLRSMTDEELAEWLERIRLCCATDLCGKICPFVEVCYSNAEAPKETLEWLKEGAFKNG